MYMTVLLQRSPSFIISPDTLCSAVSIYTVSKQRLNIAYVQIETHIQRERVMGIYIGTYSYSLNNCSLRLFAHIAKFVSFTLVS